MQYTNIDVFKAFALRHRKIVNIILSLLIVSVLIYLFNDGYSSRMNNEPFSEIQNVYLDMRVKDFDVYNKLNVRELKKEVRGLDVSSFQNEIDWNELKKSDIDYVMIRCGFRNLTNEELYVDKYFHRNIKEANRLGIPVGVYFYSTAISEKEAIEEASFVLNTIKDYDVTYPIAYDFEMFNQNRTIGVSDKTINNNALKFLDYVSAHGYNGMLYTNLRAIVSHWNLELFKNYKIWYAQYIDVPTYDGEYDMWQYTDRGSISGIDGNVDLNTSYIAYEIIK